MANAIYHQQKQLIQTAKANFYTPLKHTSLPQPVLQNSFLRQNSQLQLTTNKMPIPSIIFAGEHYQNQTRKTGEHSITHPISVMKKLQDLELPKNILITATLHDLIEDTSATFHDIKDEFGDDIAHMVYLLSKEQHHPTSKTPEGRIIRIENYIQKLETGAKKYPEIILIKLSDQIDNLKTFYIFSNDTREQKIKELQTFFMPFYEQQKINLPNKLQNAFKSLHEDFLQDLEQEVSIFKEEKTKNLNNALDQEIRQPLRMMQSDLACARPVL